MVYIYHHKSMGVPDIKLEYLENCIFPMAMIINKNILNKFIFINFIDDDDYLER
jgi:hypothetical protein